MRMKTADHSAFAKLFEEQVWSVYGFFGYRVASRAEAEDLTQLTFERALRAWERFDERRASARTWLMAIARNLLIDHYRTDRSSEHQSLDVQAVREQVELLSPGYSDLGLSAELASALQALSQREREILALRFGADLNGPEIAELTGLSLANIQQIISRSLRKLRERMMGPVAAAGRA
jgi:RNA polymerase sigma factor (sigma-70 family)